MVPGPQYHVRTTEVDSANFFSLYPPFQWTVIYYTVSCETCWKVSASDTKHWCPGITISNQNINIDTSSTSVEHSLMFYFVCDTSKCTASTSHSSRIRALSVTWLQITVNWTLTIQWRISQSHQEMNIWCSLSIQLRSSSAICAGGPSSSSTLRREAEKRSILDSVPSELLKSPSQS